ncbi:MAG: EFR1 family ferrodoxin [Oscillospiraceae bacterium]|nr:EFR1 family ferrodoxin [Oscillospiraceae bacterium]
MLGIYFSGTGNTRYAVERFVTVIDSTSNSLSIEDNGVLSELTKHEIFVFGFPVYYSNIPKIAKDFIIENKACFKGKKVFIIATKGLFNAFGVGHAKRMFKDCGAEFIGSSQFNMPDNIRDLKIMEVAFDYSKDGKMLEKADRKIVKAAEKFKAGKRQKSGLNPLNYIIGFFLKILRFYPKTDSYISAPKVDIGKCNGCGLCAELCPMKNLKITDSKVVSGSKCTVCYRCFGNCPTQALTVLGDKVYGQYVFEKEMREED